MRAEEQDLGKVVQDRRPLRTFGIVMCLALGASALGLAVWYLVAPAQRQGPQVVPSRSGPPAKAPAEPVREFVSSILGSTEDVWREQFRLQERAYKEPHLVLFTGQVRSGCGIVSSALGPTYCPLDEKIYLDLAFFREMEERYRSPGDFARAYVIAHEVGHHVQRLLGIPEKEQGRQPGPGKDQAQRLRVRLELQADFFAGVWAHHADKARHILEPGDVEAAHRLLSAIGDDRLRLEPHGDLDANSMARCWDRRHGTGRQKVRWFSRGLETGDVSQGESIDAAEL